MTTTLDIIDTAVKIGLGALISGITTYVMAKSSFDQELSKQMLDDKLAILKESAIEVEAATGKINHAAHHLCYNTKVGNQDHIDAWIKEIVEAHNNLGKAVAKCNMVGEDLLASALHDYESLSQELYEYINSNSYDVDIDEVNVITEKMSASRRNVNELVHQAYKGIYT